MSPMDTMENKSAGHKKRSFVIDKRKALKIVKGIAGLL